jgi:ABC-2 type transport system permease protein
MKNPFAALAELRALKNARWVFLKELSSFLGSNLPIVAMGVVAVLCGAVSVMLALAPGVTYEAVSRGLFHAFYIIVLVAAVILSMSSFVNERRQGTLELIYTLPVSDLELTLGKYFMGILSVTALVLVMTIVYIVGVAETPYYMTLTGFIGLLLAGYYAYSVGVFASSVSDNYLTSLLIGLGLISIVDIGAYMSGLLPDPAKSIFAYMHGLNQFFPFTRGVIPLKGVIFFGSLIFLYLFLTVKVLESRRWRGRSN